MEPDLRPVPSTSTPDAIPRERVRSSAPFSLEINFRAVGNAIAFGLQQWGGLLTVC